MKQERRTETEEQKTRRQQAALACGKVKECLYPYKSCIGCKYNYVPDLRDGGCKLVNSSGSGSF